MRLPRVDHGHRWPEKLRLLAMRLLLGAAPDVVKTLSYRPELFGTVFNRYTQQLLRGPSAWSVGERELIAAFVSSLNQCVF